MRQKIKNAPLKSAQNRNVNSSADLMVSYRERERLLQTLERIRAKKKSLERETSRLFAKAKRLDSILVRSQNEPDYLKRSE